MNPRFIHIVAALAAAILAPNARAQSSTTPPDSPPAVQMHPQPVEFPGLGVTLSLPVDALLETTKAGPAETITLRPTDSTWLITIEERRSRDNNLTAEMVASELISGLQSARVQTTVGPNNRPSTAESAVAVLNREDGLAIGGAAASRFTARSPGEKHPLIDRCTVFRAEPGRFVLMRLQCLEPELTKANAVYDAIAGSAVFRDPLAAATDRAAAVATGQGFLDSLTTASYDAAITEESDWRRLYRPAPSGLPQDAQEVAYQMVEIRRGSRGELTPERPQSRWTETDQQPGYIVRVVARYIDGARLVDSESIFFATLTLDARDEEAWTVRLRIREGNQDGVWTETGARFDDRLSVRVQAPGAQPAETTWRIPDKSYLTQVESFMLPRLLAQAQTPLAFAFYCYNSTTGKLELRRDTLETAGGAGEGWILRTRIAEGMAERETVLTEDGHIIRATTGDGVALEPIDIDRLHAIWKSKGLPTGN